jgi:hypothetical protein
MYQFNLFSVGYVWSSAFKDEVRVLQVVQTLQLGLSKASTGCLFLSRKVHTLIYDKILSLYLQNNVGMTEALVDDSGYPRQDVDVYQVRDARHKIICKWHVLF